MKRPAGNASHRTSPTASCEHREEGHVRSQLRPSFPGLPLQVSVARPPSSPSAWPCCTGGCRAAREPFAREGLCLPSPALAWQSPSPPSPLRKAPRARCSCWVMEGREGELVDLTGESDAPSPVLTDFGRRAREGEGQHERQLAAQAIRGDEELWEAMLLGEAVSLDRCQRNMRMCGLRWSGERTGAFLRGMGVQVSV